MVALRRVGLAFWCCLGLTLATGTARAQQAAPAAAAVDLLAPGLNAWKGPLHDWALADAVATSPDDPKLLAGSGSGLVLWNGKTGRTPNILTKGQYGDVVIDAEFLVPKDSNAGIKLHGHYEVQILDSYGHERVTASDCGGLYPRAEMLPRYHHIDNGYPPRVNASKPPGEWQSLQIVFRAPRFDAQGRKVADAVFERVTLNGQVVHENQSIPCPTGHNWRNRELARGPILLQGDHGPVAFRTLTVRELAPGAPAPAAAQDVPPAVDPEINKNFENPDVASFVKRFETESREVFAQRQAITAALKLQKGDSVADIGAGTGLFTRLFATEVGPDGKVIAVDIAQPFLDHIAATAKQQGQPQIATLKGSQTSTNLPPGSIDVAYLADTYHHIEHPAAVLASIHQALKPGGRLYLVEFDRDSAKNAEFIKKHVRADKATFLKEIEAAGFEPIPIEDAPKLEENFFAGFRKAERPARAGR